jgi:NitT/TauT family transport system substrate-binding protein
MSIKYRHVAAFLVGLVWITWLGALEKSVVRVGHFPNITHPQAVIGHGGTREGRGWFESFLGPDVEIQWYVFSAGPSAMEALFANSIDLVYVGPSPTINAYVRSKGEEVRVVCGACSGGAALVVQQGKVNKIADFKNQTIATPQLGNTQDIAARYWFRSRGFKFNLFGGDVHILPMENVDQLTLFKQGDLIAAWTVEPWVSRLVLEAKGEIFLEESSLWIQTGGKYTTTHLVSRRAFLEEHPDLVKKWIDGHVELTDWIYSHEQEAQTLFNQEIKKEVFQSLSLPVLQRAWKQLEATYAPLQSSVWRYAQMAFEVGILKQKPDLSRLYDLKLLHEVLENRQKVGKKDAGKS